LPRISAIIGGVRAALQVVIASAEDKSSGKCGAGICLPSADVHGSARPAAFRGQPDALFSNRRMRTWLVRDHDAFYGISPDE
jgi:hypothetical protein